MTDLAAPGAAPTEALRAADGTPLKRRLAKALFVSRVRAFALVAPLLAFIVFFFFVPIAFLLFQGVYNPDFEEGMPRTTEILSEWDGAELPGEEAYAALVADLIEARARDRALPTRVGARVNREESGALSLFKKTTRRAPRLEAPFKQALIDLDDKWADIRYWHAMQQASWSLTPSFVLKAVDLQITPDGGVDWQPEYRRIHLTLFLRTLEISVIVTLMAFLLGYPVAYLLATLPARTANLLLILVLLPFWTSILVRTTAWIAMLQGEGVLNDVMAYTSLNDVILWVMLLFEDYENLSLASLCGNDVTTVLATGKTALAAMAEQSPGQLTSCASEMVAAYRSGGEEAGLQVAQALETQAMRSGYGDERFSLIYNKTGTLIAMTHILLPFMILPLYSVMKSIPPSYVRAAKSLGASNWTAFWRVYFPNTVPGIGAGAILVFILAIGYYITPALLGGQDGVMISNIIDDHMRKSLNYSLAAALGLVLLVFVLICYWLYDRVVGIDNMKLG